MAKPTVNDKDLRKLLAEVDRQGFTWKLASNGHPQCYKDGRRVATLAKTPSDRRAWKNGLADLRRAGFIWQGR